MANDEADAIGPGGDFAARMQQIEALVHELEAAPDPRLRDRAQALVGAVMDLHKAGLARALEIVRASGDASTDIVSALAGDDLVASVLCLHDIHPVPFDRRVRRAIDTMAARAKKHGVDVALVDSADRRLVVRIAAGAGCNSSSGTWRQIVEDAVYAAAPDVAAIAFESTEPPAAGFVSLQQLRTCKGSDPRQPATTL